MGVPFTVYQLANAVWNLIGVGSRTVTVADKTGFSLTAGSYSVRAGSTQRGSVLTNDNTGGTAGISSVTTTRATEGYGGQSTTTSPQTESAKVLITSATVITASRGTSGGTAVTPSFVVTELL